MYGCNRCDYDICKTCVPIDQPNYKSGAAQALAGGFLARMMSKKTRDKKIVREDGAWEPITQIDTSTLRCKARENVVYRKGVPLIDFITDAFIEIGNSSTKEDLKILVQNALGVVYKGEDRCRIPAWRWKEVVKNKAAIIKDPCPKCMGSGKGKLFGKCTKCRGSRKRPTKRRRLITRLLRSEEAFSEKTKSCKLE